MGKKKLLDFKANISNVQQINPLFSTCKVRVLYTGLNRNMSIISKDSVERALPTIKNIPIVGEFSETIEDFKGHGGAIDLDSYKFIHTTKPYGVVPESATYEWESIGGREYLTIDGCYLWTGRYEEANSVIQKGKGQSMEIEVVKGEWNDKEEAYQIHDFTFSALCILGDDVEPAFENSDITSSTKAYSLDKDSFKRDFSLLLSELKESLSDKEDNKMLQELLKKYNLTTEQLEEKGIDYKSLTDAELETSLVEVFGKAEVKVENTEEPKEDPVVEPEIIVEEPKPETDEGKEPPVTEPTHIVENIEKEHPKANIQEDNLVPVVEKPLGENNYELRVKELEDELKSEKAKTKDLKEKVESLEAFKLETEKAIHEEKATEMFKKFKLTNEDVDNLDIHKFSLEELEEKCFAILGRKTNSQKFSKNENEGIKLPLGNASVSSLDEDDGYGGLFSKYKESN